VLFPSTDVLSYGSEAVSVSRAQLTLEREPADLITEQHPDERIAWKSIGRDTTHADVVTFHRLSDSQTG
jgi:hypothetical protein